MNEEELSIYRSLVQSLNASIQLRDIAVQELNRERGLLDLYQKQLDSLVELMNLIRSPEYEVVDIKEAITVKADLHELKIRVKKSASLVNQMESALNFYEQDIEYKTNIINDFKKKTDGAVVIAFRRPNGDKR